MKTYKSQLQIEEKLSKIKARIIDYFIYYMVFFILFKAINALLLSWWYLFTPILLAWLFGLILLGVNRFKKKK